LKISKWILLCGLVCAAGAGQLKRPDFTGTWKLNLDRSTPDGPAGRTYLNEIQQRDSVIQVATKATPPPESLVLDGTFKIGNSATAKPRAERVDGHYRSTLIYWENTTLVFYVRERESSNAKSKLLLALRESWVLSPDGRTLTKFRMTSRAGGPPVDQKYVFEKQ
jgi:hypothetical protein